MLSPPMTPTQPKLPLPSPNTPDTSPVRPEPLPRNPSSGPPPAYTPRPEFVVPGGQRTAGIRVTADGSPRVSESEYVESGDGH